MQFSGSMPRAIGRRVGAVLACAALLLAAALFMFVDRRVTPIILWDESRLAVNALEMSQTGWSLVTTYGFAPDLWNTKPPLMIWLMNASIHVFGASELALRLPAMLAALGTLAIVFAFTRRATCSLATAGLATLLLTISLGFYGEHGARTADYDALLCFCTTGYLALLHFAVHRRRPGWRHLLLAFALVAAAAMTKTVAGLVPGLGVAVYLLVTGRLGRTLADLRYPALLLLALVPLAWFYLAREQVAPGYLAAVWHNDMAGRFHDNIATPGATPTYYLELLFSGLFCAGPLALFAPLGLLRARGRQRQALLFALCCVVALLVVLTATATKLAQYLLPALPWLAIACAITIGQWLPALVRARPPLARLALLAVLAAVALDIGHRTLVMRYDLLVQRADYPQSRYGALFAALHDRGITRVTVVEPGIPLERIKAYQPQLRYYALLWNARGMAIDWHPAASIPAAATAIASCDPDLRAALLGPGRRGIEAGGCTVTVPAPHG